MMNSNVIAISYREEKQTSKKKKALKRLVRQGSMLSTCNSRKLRRSSHGICCQIDCTENVRVTYNW